AMGAKKDERTNQVFIIAQKEFEDIIQKIHDNDSNKEWVVRLLSSINVIKAEPIVTYFGLMENKLVTVIMAIKIPLIIVINIAVKWGRRPKTVTLFLPILKPTQSPTKAINPLIIITIDIKIRLYMSFGLLSVVHIVVSE
ncbi:unnamed protein product, partial [marine sediment metagenome]